MTKPTVGRIVWYWPGDAEKALMRTIGRDPLVGVITAVFQDGSVNLVVFDAGNAFFGVSGVFLYQGGGPRPYGGFCEWMPDQVRQSQERERR